MSQRLRTPAPPSFWRVLAAIGLVTLSPLALAQSEWSVQTGLAYTDNARLSEFDAVSDYVASVGGAVALEHESRRINASLNGYGAFLHYIDNTYDDDFAGRATGSVVFGFVPERILWTIEDTYGQIAINPYDPITVENRQSINYFSTGPDVVLPLGDRTDLRIGGRYGDTRYEEDSQVNSQNWGGSLSLERTLSGASSLGLTASTNRVAYDTPMEPMYDQQALYLTYRLSGARQTISVDVGANRIAAGDRDSSDPLVRLAWDRTITPSLTMGVHLRSEYMNTSQRFASDVVIDDPGADSLQVYYVPAATYGGDLSFAFTRPRSTASLRGGYTLINRISDLGGDEDSWFAMADLSRRFTPSVRGFVQFRYMSRHYDEGIGTVFASDWDERVAGAGLEWKVGGSTGLTFGYSHTTSDGDTHTYNRNLFFLSISYGRGDTGIPIAFGY